MNETVEKKEKTNDLRVLWLVLIPIFAAVIFLNLYRWNAGEKEMGAILAPMGMIFVGLGQFIRKRNDLLYYALSGIALILIISGLVVLAIN